MEYASRGNLKDFLTESKSCKSASYVTVAGNCYPLPAWPSLGQFIQFAHQVACGMAYVSSFEVSKSNHLVFQALVHEFCRCSENTVWKWVHAGGVCVVVDMEYRSAGVIFFFFSFFFFFCISTFLITYIVRAWLKTPTAQIWWKSVYESPRYGRMNNLLTPLRSA